MWFIDQHHVTDDASRQHSENVHWGVLFVHDVKIGAFLEIWPGWYTAGIKRTVGSWMKSSGAPDLSSSVDWVIWIRECVFFDFQLIAQKQIWFWVESTVCYLKMAFFFYKTGVKVLAAGMRGANWTEMRNVRRALVLLVTVSRHTSGWQLHSQLSVIIPDLQCSLVARGLPSAMIYVGVGLFLRLLTAFFFF